MADVALITGASSGLGQSLAYRLAEEGYHVFGTSRSPRSDDKPFAMLRLDLGDVKSIRAALDELMERAGRIDLLINNAGLGIAGPLEELQLEHVEQVFDTNVFGTLRMCQAVLPGMREQGHGRIINISSIGSVVGLPFRGAYCASKSAVDMLSETLRLEVASFGIEVCSVRAGDIRTPINEHRIMDYDPTNPVYRDTFERVARAMNEEVEQGMPPEDVAEAIVRLLRQSSLPPTLAVGKWLQRASIPAKGLLPERWFERIIRMYTKH